jgi:imidazolonepropionase-like amidohydrolase
LRALGKSPARFPRILVAALFPGLVPAIASAQEEAEPLLIRNITVIDGTGAPPQPSMDVEIRDGRIADVRPTTTDGEFDGRVQDGTDLFAIPGLIDSHVHLSTGSRDESERTLRWLLEGGVTAVRDMAGDARPLAALAADQLKARILGPAIYYSALMAGPAFLSDPRLRDGNVGYVNGQAPYAQAVTDETDVVRAIAQAKGTGATGLKLYAAMGPELVRRLTVEAHAQGLEVWGHSAVFPARPVEILEAGVDAVSHAPYVIWEGAARTDDFTLRGRGDFDGIPFDDPAIDKVLGAMVDNGTVLDPTLFVFYAPSGAFSDDTAEKRFAWAAAFTRRAAAAGVTLAAGTDAPGEPVAGALPNLHKEIELYVNEVGLTPAEALRAATSGGAHAIGMEDRMGRIAPGYDANLVLLAANPTSDITNTRRILGVIQNGRTVR